MPARWHGAGFVLIRTHHRTQQSQEKRPGPAHCSITSSLYILHSRGAESPRSAVTSVDRYVIQHCLSACFLPRSPAGGSSRRGHGATREIEMVDGAGHVLADRRHVDPGALVLEVAVAGAQDRRRAQQPARVVD